jgi:hypothetical protein
LNGQAAFFCHKGTKAPRITKKSFLQPGVSKGKTWCYQVLLGVTWCLGALVAFLDFCLMIRVMGMWVELGDLNVGIEVGEGFREIGHIIGNNLIRLWPK